MATYSLVNFFPCLWNSFLGGRDSWGDSHWYSVSVQQPNLDVNLKCQILNVKKKNQSLVQQTKHFYLACDPSASSIL